MSYRQLLFQKLTIINKTTRDQMEAQDEQRYGSAMPDVTAALLDFARLSQGVAASEEPGLIAAGFLERLLTLFVAQKGAVLLTTQYLKASKSPAMSSLPPRKLFRPFALADISEEEAVGLLTHFSMDSPDIQVPPGEPGWLICKLSVMTPPTTNQDAVTLAHADAPASSTLLPLYALVLLGWTVKDECVRINMVERGRMIMPLVADGFGAAVLNVQQAERIHELETISDRRALREMELLKAELLATVSHELRSPLASIKGYAATLLRHERRISREERHEFLVAIAAASDRLERSIDRLLEMSQLESGEVMIDRSPVDMVYLTKEAIAAIEERISEKQPGRFLFKLLLERADGTLATSVPLILADQRRLREVMDNLLENAVKFSPGGGVIKVILHPVMQVQTNLIKSPVDDHQPMHISRQMLEMLV